MVVLHDNQQAERGVVGALELLGVGQADEQCWVGGQL